MNKQFKEWLEVKSTSSKNIELNSYNGHVIFCPYVVFNDLPFSMQWGVYLEFFDSVGIDIGVIKCEIYEDSDFDIWAGEKWSKEIKGPRTEAQQEAIKKALQILENEQ